MTEEIIIDGVDVAECNFRLERDGKQKCECCHATGFGVICACESWKNCYYKQFKRTEQENKELKELIGKTRYNRLEMYESFKTECNNYRSALEEIKNNFMCFRSCMIPFHVGNKENLPHNMADTIQNYCESIMNKINEVLQ